MTKKLKQVETVKPKSLMSKEQPLCPYCECAVRITVKGVENSVKLLITACDMCQGSYKILESIPPKLSEQEAGLKFNKIHVPPPDYARPKGQGKIKVLDSIEGMI